jgi:type I restriction enzyme S subunit
MTKTQYKQTPIGLIPIDWEVKSLGELGETLNGLTYSPNDIVEKSEGVLVLRSSNIQNDNLVFEDNVFVKSKNLKYNPVKINDILICVRNGSKSLIGKNTLINEKAEGMAFGAFMSIYRSNLNPYLYQCFKSNIYQNHIEKNLGATINSINGSDLKHFLFPLPPLPEQQKIAEILSTWDKAIQEVGLLIKKLEVRNKALAFSLLTGKKRVKGFEGKEFKKSFANQVFKSVSVKNNTENVELLSATQENGIIPRSLLETRVTMPSGSLNTYKLVQKGDFVISLRSFQGGIEYSEYTGVVSPAYTVLKPINPINDNFYKYYFKSRDLIGRLSVAVIGIRDGKNISYDDFSTIILPNPSLEEQTAIAEILNTAQQELKQYQEKLKALQQQKKGLMQQLLTGKLRTI